MNSNIYNELERCISSSRLFVYQLPSNDYTSHSTMMHYLWNTKLSENFYLLLQNLEVGLRNAIHYEFSKQFPAQHFFAMYESDISKSYIKRREYHSYGCWKMIGKVKSNLKAQGIAPSDGKVISELNFGFWTTLLMEKHYRIKLWRSLVRFVFPNYPFSSSQDKDIKLIAQKINNIRVFRNRIFHYEPIFNRSNLHKIHDDILEVLGWISPEIQKMSQSFDEFDKIIRSKHRIDRKIKRLYPSKYKHKRKVGKR